MACQSASETGKDRSEKLRRRDIVSPSREVLGNRGKIGARIPRPVGKSQGQDKYSQGYGLERVESTKYDFAVSAAA